VLRANGLALPLRVKRTPTTNRHAVVLEAERKSAALLTMSWQNWCGAHLRTLRIKLTLKRGGAVVAPFDGPRDYNYLPGCIAPGRPSIIEILDAYGTTG
jgi:hypothetical protein